MKTLHFAHKKPYEKRKKPKQRKQQPPKKKHLKKTKFPWRDRAIQIVNNKVMNKNMSFLD